MKKKGLITAALITVMSLSSISSVYAGDWKSDDKGWWWQEDNGIYPVSTWKEINGKHYYFGTDGYMLSNTTTPDGYKVGADGAWIQEGSNTKTLSNVDFYEEPGYLTISDQAIFYARPYIYNNGLYCCDLDGTNERFLADKIFSTVKGADGKIYYTDTQNLRNRLNRFSSDGKIKEEDICSFTGGSNTIQFADANGIQLKYGYYDITTGQYNEGLIKEKKTPYRFEETPQNIKNLIPHNDYETSHIFQQVGDYIVVGTHVYNPANDWMHPNDQMGTYIINTKTKACVAYHKWEKGYKGEREQFGTLSVTELGLLAGAIRIEDGGREVKLFDVVTPTNSDGVDDFHFKVVGTTIYYLNGDYNVFIVNNVAPAPLPTSKVN